MQLLTPPTQASVSESSQLAGVCDWPCYEFKQTTNMGGLLDLSIQGKQPERLLPFVGNEHQEMPKGLLFDTQDYFNLVDDTGRTIRDDKRGVIQPSTANILHRLNIPLENWLKITHEFKYLFTGPVGTLEDVTRYCARLGKKRVAHANSCRHWQR